MVCRVSTSVLQGFACSKRRGSVYAYAFLHACQHMHPACCWPACTAVGEKAGYRTTGHSNTLWMPYKVAQASRSDACRVLFLTWSCPTKQDWVACRAIDPKQAAELAQGWQSQFQSRAPAQRARNEFVVPPMHEQISAHLELTRGQIWFGLSALKCRLQLLVAQSATAPAVVSVCWRNCLRFVLEPLRGKQQGLNANKCRFLQ